MKRTNLILTTALIGAVAAPAFAETEAMTTTALNLREGPSEFNTVTTVLDQSETVMIQGCLEGLTWCQVMTEDGDGWVSGDYLAVGENAEPVAQLNADGTAVYNILTVTVEETDDNVDGAAAGAVIGALAVAATGGAAGPIVAGALGGLFAGDVADEITEDDVTFVTTNRVETIYLDGEVVVGASVPSNVETFEIPNSTYRYLVINGTPVIVNTDTGAIVGIVR